ncbi:hypothetical protein BY458DRAFT_560511 [Sporodiniella umbellata]|nr:hypothetical protein BY458DRAFT_560511 [Sporodiniella umbellata]
MKTAILAASRTKHQQIHNPDAFIDPYKLKAELQNARKQKLEQQLHQARREIKSALKKSKTTETQKQIKKIKASKATKNDEKATEKKTKEQDVVKLEQELDILKNVDLENLTEKKIKSTLQKNSGFKTEELVQELIQSISLKNQETVDKALLSNVEARLLSHKAVLAECQNIIQSFNSTLKGDSEKIEKKKVEGQEKKRKTDELKLEKEDLQTKKQKKTQSSASTFMDSLGADDEKNDENFQTIYEGVKKPNRVGQRQRRKQWEEMYGKKANHVVADYQKREEKRLANPNYKPKKVATPAMSRAPAEPVHPSWEAKRQQQEMMSKALSGQGSSNNKIVFDD